MTWRGWEHYTPPIGVGAKALKARTKYGAQPTTVDGIRFDSKREAARYSELKLLEAAGEIRDLELQPRFPLFVASTTGSPRELIRIGEYRADFKYREKGGRGFVVEDCKGFRTALYRWKKRHVEAQYNVIIRET